MILCIACLNQKIVSSKMTDINNAIQYHIKKAADEFAQDFSKIREAYQDDSYRNGLFHAGEFGAHRERIVSQLIRKFLPRQFGLGSGFVVNPSSEKTTQVDVVIYDDELTPKLEADEARFYPYETVVALGEVKSTLSISTMGDAIEKMRHNKKIRECVPTNPYPLRPAGLSEAMVHHLLTVPAGQFDQWGDFKHLMDVFNKFRSGQPLDDPSEAQGLSSLIFNLKYFEELNVVTFLVCDEIEKFGSLENRELSKMFFKRDTANEHLGFNLILSIKDGLILHAANGRTPSPYPKIRNTKSALYIKRANGTDNSHIVMFVAMLLHALSSTAIFEFSPLPYMNMGQEAEDYEPSLQLLREIY